jgi:predicted O-linked N-acetylglucosamine transferase (SPINDLY family)
VELRTCCTLSPTSPGPPLNLGKALLETGRNDAAAAVLEAAVRKWPQIGEGHHTYGNALAALGKHRQAADAYRAAIRLAPGEDSLYENLGLTLTDLCAWDGHAELTGRLAKLVKDGRAGRGMPLLSMLLWDDGSLHRRSAELAARTYAQGEKAALAPPRPRTRRGARIRVAYVSADFRRHPVARLVAGLIEAHDRTRFEIIGISIGRDDGSAERQRLAGAFDRFLDMRTHSAGAVVQTMREHEIDVAVDLMGYTDDCRPQIFLSRAAPVQVNFLGFPGTSGMAAMDYIVVDPFIASGDLRSVATEKLVILPDCYQCNQGWRPPAVEVPSRSDCGLPEDGVVFCNFNQAKKITPDVYDLWMRILRRVEGSVLWLLKPPDAAAANLRSEAERRGVDPQRVVFADRVEHELHIARNGLPDLHLDTFPYNAHTTASDALRGGAPILTRAGASFPARVCASLLTTIGVPELITVSPEAYANLAVELAHDRERLAALRRRIEHGRAHSPLFDTVRFCRNIEAAYSAMVEHSRAGEAPEEIDMRIAHPP